MQYINSYTANHNIEGYFGMADYDYSNKYYLSAAFRRDGTSRFLDRWGNFWSVGAAWRISNEAFMEKYPNVSATAEFTGSSAGIESLTAGSVDIGDASRALSDDEKSQGVVENIVAIDGIAVITDTANTVTDIKSEDLAKVYTGEITNWKDLGGPDEQIVVIGREAGSGTRDAFEELMDVKDSCKYAQELDSTGAVLAKVAATPGAVGYVSLDVLDDTVNGLKINSVEPTEDNILAGDYVLQRPFVMATKGEISEQSKQVQAYFDFINSADGQNVIKSVGLIIPNSK